MSPLCYTGLCGRACLVGPGCASVLILSGGGCEQRMAHYQAPGTILEPTSTSTTAPLVVLFERDEGIAVPLLSQLRIAGYDIRSARTPVELFGVLSKQLVALVLIDLGNAAAGRREF